MIVRRIVSLPRFRPFRCLSTDNVVPQDEQRDQQFKGFDLPKVTEPAPVKPIIPVNIIRLVFKEGSFIRNLFLGKFDKDYLTYPEVLRSRHHYKELVRQQEVINKYFRGLVMRDPGKNLPSFGFNHLWFLTKTEMINVLEGVGHSMGSELYSPHDNSDIEKFRVIMEVIMNNVSLSLINASENEALSRRVMDELNQNPSMKIGFAWSEDRDKPSSSFADWETEAVLSTDSKKWVVSGEKCSILAGDYDYYLLFCRTKDYPGSRRPAYLITQTLPYDGVVVLLIPKHLCASIQEYWENGMKYQKIQLVDILLPIEDFEVAPAEVDGVRAHNYKSLAQLCLSSLMVGHMKLQLEETYSYFVKNKISLAQCELVGNELADLTESLYEVESALYFTSAMFDVLEKRGNPEVSLEGSLTKVMVTRAAQSFADHLVKLSGSSRTCFAPLNDWIYRCDNFLGDSFNETMRVAVCGMDLMIEQKAAMKPFMAQSPYGTARITGAALLEFRRVTLFTDYYQPLKDLQGYLHPNLKQDAVFLEQMVRCLEYVAEIYFTRFDGKLDLIRERDLHALGEIALRIFATTTVLARASRAYTETLRNAYIDIELAHHVLAKYRKEIHALVEKIEKHDMLMELVPFRRCIDQTMELHHPLMYDPFDWWTTDQREDRDS